MKAVFLDRATFSPDLDTAPPAGVTTWEVYERTANDPATVIARLRGAEIAISNKVKIGAEVIAACPQLKLVQVAATGTNNVDHEACAAAGVAVRNVAGYSTTSVAEHTFMLLLAALRGLVPYHQAVVNGDWQRDGRFCLTEPALCDVAGKTLTIIGAGSIGQRVSALARAFGMRVLWAERRDTAPRSQEYTPFAEALAEADVISLHCPLTPATHHLINRDTLALCQRAPLLINVARGDVVDSGAVVAALATGQLSGFASDVFAAEPPPADEALLTLKNHPRVLFTPHNAWASVAAQQQLWATLRQQVADFIGENK